MTHVQRKDRVGKQLRQPLVQTLLPVQHDLHTLGCLGRKPSSRGLLASPLQGQLSLGVGAPDLFIDRSVQSSVLATSQRVHHHQRDAPPVLALLASFPAFLLLSLPFLLPAVTLAAARASARVLVPRAAAFGQLLLGRGGRCLTVHLDDQHFTVIFRRRRCFHVGPGPRRAQTQHQLFNRLARRGPANKRLENRPGRRVADPGGQACHQPADTQAKAVRRDAQSRIQWEPAASVLLVQQVSSSVGYRSAKRFEGPHGKVVFDAILPIGQVRLHVQPFMPYRQEQTQQQPIKHRDLRPKGVLKSR